MASPDSNGQLPDLVPLAARWVPPRYLEDLTADELERAYAWVEALIRRGSVIGTPAGQGLTALEALLATVYREICRRTTPRIPWATTDEPLVDRAMDGDR